MTGSSFQQTLEFRDFRGFNPTSDERRSSNLSTKRNSYENL